MKLLTRDAGEITAAAGRHVQASSHGDMPLQVPSSVELLPGADGIARWVRYAEIYYTNPWVRRAVRARAAPVGRTPIHVFGPSNKPSPRPGERDRIRKSDAGPGAKLARLMDEPEEGVSPLRWRSRITSSRLIQGMAVTEKVRDRSGEVVQLRWWPWTWVKPIIPDGLHLEGIKVPVDSPLNRRSLTSQGPNASKWRAVDRNDLVMWWGDDDTEGGIGRSPLESLASTHALHDAALRFALNYIGNGIHPSGVIEAPAGTPLPALQATRELLQQLYSGVERSGEPLMIAGKWQQISATPEGARLVELSKACREEVAAGYGVPMSILGATSDTNKATAEVDRTRFIQDTVGEDEATLEAELNTQLVAKSPRWSAAGLWLEGQLGELLRPDMVERLKALESAKGFMTINERRRVENLPPIDEPWADLPVLDPGTQTPNTEPPSSSGDGA